MKSAFVQLSGIVVSLLAVPLVGAGCASADRDSPRVIGGSGGTSASGGAGDSGGTATGTSGGTTGSSGGSAGVQGTGGQAPTYCEYFVVAEGTDAMMMTFDDLEVGTAVPVNGFSNADGFMGGWYSYAEEGATQALTVISNGQSGNGMQFVLSNGDEWGGGFGCWATCLDARAYDGIQFYAKGTAGYEVMLMLGNRGAAKKLDGGDCDAPANDWSTCVPPSYTFKLGSDWQLVQVPWSALTPGSNAGTPFSYDPKEFVSMEFIVSGIPHGLAYGEPFPETIVAIDEVSFMDGSSVGTGGAGGAGGSGS